LGDSWIILYLPHSQNQGWSTESREAGIFSGSCCLSSVSTHEIYLHLPGRRSREFPEGDTGMRARTLPGFVREQCFRPLAFAFSARSRPSIVANLMWRSAGGPGAWYLFSPGPAGDPASLPAASPRRVPQQGGTPRRAPPPRQDQPRAFAVCARERVSWGPASRLPGPPALHRCGAGMLRRKGCTPWWGYALCRYFVLK